MGWGGFEQYIKNYKPVIDSLVDVAGKSFYINSSIIQGAIHPPYSTPLLTTIHQVLSHHIMYHISDPSLTLIHSF